jgi:hypothetical protein
MINFIKNLFKQKEIEKLKNDNLFLKSKLDEKQEVINQTNAYWKKKIYTVKNQKSKSN